MQLLSGDANLREQVVDQLRIAIVSGEMPPGAVCSVPSLARTLGISTTPIREALLQLTSDGLLQPMRNRGFRVVDPSLDELRAAALKDGNEPLISDGLRRAGEGMISISEVFRVVDSVD